MQNDILFDNIYIGHSISDAEKFQKETYDIKRAAEKKEEEKDKPKKDDSASTGSDVKFMDDPVVFVREKLELFIDLAKRDPVQAIKLMPETFGAIGLGVVTILALLVGIIGGGAKAAPSKEQVKGKAAEAQKKAQETKDQVADAVASGTNQAKEEVNKRTTRSAAASSE